MYIGKDEGLKGNKRRIKNQKGVKTKFGLSFLGKQKREEEERRREKEEEKKKKKRREGRRKPRKVWNARILYGKVWIFI